MITDDEYDITPIVRIILEGDNFGIDMWSDPKIALSNYCPNFYDLIVLNLKLPYSSDYEDIKRIDTLVRIPKSVF